jgi:response regulator RpfG family c-di-GMP phosphodiesterase
MDMTELSTASILMVDDEPNILDGYRRALRGRFEVTTATSGPDALGVVRESVAQGKPFTVVVSDMMMPAMDGAQFLGRARSIDPDAVQILLSGQADLDSTIAAVNHGNLFRILTKPCSPEDLEVALVAGLEQHRLAGAERELLSRTLGGAIAVLTDLLSLASPEALTRTERVQTLVDVAAEHLGIDDWRLQLSTRLSQIGCVAVPGDVLRRARTGVELTPEELSVYLTHPQTARRLLERIPRLEDVARWVGDQPVRPPSADPDDQSWQLKPDGATGSAGESAELLLRAGLSLLALIDSTGRARTALTQVSRTNLYPQVMVEALAEAVGGLAMQGVLRELSVREVRPGMLLEADVETKTGMTLVRRGERVSEAAAIRLANFARTVGVKEPIMVLEGV